MHVYHSLQAENYLNYLPLLYLCALQYDNFDLLPLQEASNVWGVLYKTSTRWHSTHDGSLISIRFY